MNEPLDYVRARIEEAMFLFAERGRLPAEAMQRFTEEEEMPLPEAGPIEPFVRYRQADNVDLDLLYQGLKRGD